MRSFVVASAESSWAVTRGVPILAIAVVALVITITARIMVRRFRPAGAR